MRPEELNGRNGMNHPISARPRPAAYFRYLGAFGLVIVSATLVCVVDLALSFPPFLFFAIATGVVWILFGTGPAIFSVGLSALLSDFLFLHPRYELSLNETTAWLATVYAACVLFSRIAEHWSGRGPRMI